MRPSAGRAKGTGRSSGNSRNTTGDINRPRNGSVPGTPTVQQPVVVVLSAYKIFRNQPFSVSVIFLAGWRAANRITDEMVYNAGINSICCPPDSNEPLTCSRCSTFKVPLITVSTSSDLVPQVMDDDSEMFTFDSCRSNCSSSRDHINSSITLVVTGLCNPPPRSSTFDLLSRMHKTKFYSQHRLISSKSTSHHKAQKRPKPSSEPQQPSPETTGILAPPPLSPHQVKVPLPVILSTPPSSLLFPPPQPVLFTPPPPLYHPPPHQLPNEAEEEQDEEVEYNNLMDEEHFQLKLLQQQQQQQPPQQIQRFQTPSTLYTRRDFYTTTTPTTIPQSASQPPVLPRFNEIVAASTTSAINTTTPTPSPTPAPPTPLSSTTTTDTRAAPTTAASLVATTTAATRAAPTLASSLRRVDSPPTPTEQRRSPTNKS